MFGAYAGMFRSLANQAEGSSPSNSPQRLAYLENADKVIKVRQYDSETGMVRAYDMQLGIVKPSKSTMMPTRDDINIYEYINSPGIIMPVLRKITGIIAVDIETKGTQAADPDTEIVGVGIASMDTILYLDFATNTHEVNAAVLDWLREYQGPMVGHNVFFDGAFLLRETGKWLNWKYDTYGLYRQLATEGYPGQTYGLKTAQLQLLNWPVKGDVDLDQWLINNGYHSDIKKDKKMGYYPGPAIKGEPRFYKPSKGEMWRAPARILGHYCALDAASTLLLLTDVFLPSVEGQPWAEEFLSYHDLFMTNVELLANQQLTGITIDKTELIEHQHKLESEITEGYHAFFHHPQVVPVIEKLNQEHLEDIKSKEPEKFKKMKFPKEPAQFKKDGTVSVSWQNWEKRMAELTERGPELSKNWTNWNERFEEAKKANHLNLNSGPQLQRLFYDELGYPVIIYTESGEPSVGSKAIPAFGEVGQLLSKVREKEKELGYVKGCVEALILDAEGNWRLHPQFRAPGTLTCRLAGSGGVNLQQIPKSRGYLECWKPKPGKAWIDCDHTALEQVVMAELTRDTALFKIYGPDARPNDIYLFNGSQLPIIGDKIRAAGYDPDYPDPETISAVKKQCKKERGISKVITLGSSYGMGPGKLQQTLALQGVDITPEDAKAMHSAYWRLYGGVKEYEAYLLQELKDNNGYVLNGVGRPVCCAPDYTKDIVNRVVQSTGHDVHMMYMAICHRLLNEAGIEHDGIVWDFHDQTILECNEEDAERLHYIIGTLAYEVLNQELDGVIKLKGDPQHIKDMAAAKCG
jgi:DNA polymerase I-like protein with 3'-5' exonuclease and polymerase domains